jgi:hypothetical protein
MHYSVLLGGEDRCGVHLVYVPLCTVQEKLDRSRRFTKSTMMIDC